MEKTIREFSSGGVVYKKVKNKKGDLQILWLVAASATSQLFPDIVWRLPKGWIDDGGENVPGPIASGQIKADEKTLREAALREVREEGGIKAGIISKLGTEKYFFKHPSRGQILKFVTFYLMEWIEDLPEGHDNETSEIAWLEYEEARKKLSFSGEKKVLTHAFETVDRVS